MLKPLMDNSGLLFSHRRPDNPLNAGPRNSQFGRNISLFQPLTDQFQNLVSLLSGSGGAAFVFSVGLSLSNAFALTFQHYLTLKFRH